MSTENASNNAPPPPSPPKSGARIVLERTGVPSWVFQKPKLPSRNWLIFISVVSTLTGSYLYDRQQCKRIRREYVDKVKHLADEPLGVFDYARKITVYGGKWPGDEDYERSMKYFRKYVKPILVAAAVDYDMVKGRRLGDITDRIAKEIQARRRLEAGLDTPSSAMPLPTDQSLETKRRRELEGGIVIVGRPTFKEFMAGLKKGWSEGLEVVDPEEKLARELESDGHFDEEEEPLDTHASIGFVAGDEEPIPTPSRLPPSTSIYSPIQLQPPSSPSQRPGSPVDSSSNTAPSVIPELPPLLLVPFVNYLGFTQIPLMLWEFFNERKKVQAGSEAAYSLIMKQTRPFTASSSAPSSSTEFVSEDVTQQTPSERKLTPSSATVKTDLDFDTDAESYYKSSLRKIPDEITKARTEYYASLPAKLKTARDLSRGLREPTKDEKNYPPPTEVELRAERMKKEVKWRKDLAGWLTVKPETDVEWDERFRSALKVFTEPTEGSRDDGFGSSSI
ncbi:hypothetical protein JAAARDRAFT_173611 [Jaapia argillacea MUCL 33604]|uniref:Mitochondrial import inner membrane translocase subunit TIM54 n=1 Tax=Jaapia argillacea MUCL 33604 TaxID=933084 RepID=A0A067Q4K0_9AGAM|nr:hypothetical protein JAAARDRAFT_173611 [Jaapia argillacea MUCL 33604]